MIDTQKVSFLKRVMMGVIFLLVFLVGLGFGQMGHHKEVTPKSQQTTKTAKEGTALTNKWVKSFLVAYYTKKDLGENRNRYKEYMTEGLYTATVSEENEAQNQAYKGYVVNFTFSSVKLYINTKDNEVIAQVHYTNDLLQKKNSSSGAQTNVDNSTTLKLSYTEVNGKYLVNQMTTLLMTSSDSNVADQAYGDVTANNTTTNTQLSSEEADTNE
ncbi:TPA: hypothetical protein ACJ5UW_000855 [Streptococcus agalactiae]|jgi:hypothetical protein|uniref:hypothetical protein n=1 Tax=Streptococcus TaxID=1301 RepID=UPI000390699E|nr:MULTISPECIES: hypothetical protein [Streptococcus]AGU79765.1 hypothetical protein SCI_0817 [Streptococcus constellatus subsp. pharyngis C1050]EUC75420.1 hypothetical protein HMPREF1511_1148 [Streptococcus sp. CM7]MCW1080533.1 hypothetical protein [Streptococcus anginosus]MCW1088579.1 hypothetical protein [Streptococcus anginosus]MDX5092783.1 hypothetical protein [Streptococcus anginosus]